MTKKLLLRVAVSVVLMGMELPAWAAAPSPANAPTTAKAGNITALLPVARIARGTGKNLVTNEAKKGDGLVWNDVVRTDKGGRARITLADQSILSLGSQAELKIVQHDARAQQTALTLTYGRLRAEVTRITRDGGGFTVRTPTAVAGVIGTDFATLASEMAAEFVCISGQVGITGTDVPERVVCNAGDYVRVEKGKAPSPPKPATQEQIQQVIQETEPAIITALSPASAVSGSTALATATGTQLGGVTSVSVAGGAGVQVSLQPGGTDTSLGMQITVAAGAAPGPRTLTFNRRQGLPAAAVFMVVTPGGSGGTTADIARSYTDVFEQERSSTIASLNGMLVGLQQSVQRAGQQLDAANTTHADLATVLQQFQAQIDAAVRAAQAAGGAVNNAAQTANRDFQQRIATAQAALRQRNPDGAPDAQFTQEAATAFSEVNTVFNSSLRAAHDAVGNQILEANNTIASLTKNSLAQLRAAGRAAGASRGEAHVEVGDAFTFRASSSAASYQWTLCNASGACNPLPGFTATTPDFSALTCGLNPGDYLAKLTGTDANGRAISESYALHVLPPTYDDPATQLRNLAAAYSSLQSARFLSFFDPNFGGLPILQENIRRTFAALSSMNINLRISQAQVSCNDATVRADWQQNYSFPQNTGLVYHQEEQLTARFTRVPGRGWLINDFQGDNGTVQGLPPGPATTDLALPELRVTNIVTVAAQGGGGGLRAANGREGNAVNPVPVAPGTVNVRLTVVNVGRAPLTQAVTIHVALLDLNHVELAGGDVVVNPPLAVGGTVDIQATVQVPQLPPGTGGQLIAIVNPGCRIPTTNCGAASTSFQVVTVGTVDLAVQSITAANLVATLAGSATVNIRNTGTITSNPVTVVLTSPDFPGFTASSPVPAIGPGASLNVTVNFTAPNGTGAHVFRAQITPAAQFDINPANDTGTASLTLAPRVVDLALNGITLQTQGNLASGLSTTLVLQLQNLGSAPPAASDTISCTLTGPLGSSNLGSIATPPLTGGTGANQTFTFTVPANRAGNDTITCTLSQDPFETNIANNSRSLSVVVGLNVDLAFDQLPPVQRNYQMGDTVNLNVTVRNAGGDTTDSTWAMVVKLNNNVVATVPGPQLAGGATTVLTSTFQVPQLQAAPADVVGSLEVDLNPTGSQTETNTQNNVFGPTTVNLQDFVLQTTGTSFPGVAGRAFNATVLNVLPATYSTTLGPNITLSAALPAGLQLARTPATNIQGTPGQTGTFSFTATGTAGLVQHPASAPVVLQIGPEFTVTSVGATSFSNQSGTATYSVQVSGGLYPANVTLALPSGMTTTSPLTQPLNAPGAVSWPVSAVGVAVGNPTINGVVTDGGIPGTNTPTGNFAFSTNVSVSSAPPQANYVVGAVSVATHQAPPFTGSNAFVTGEAVAIVAQIQNVGGGTASGTITATFSCTDPQACTTPIVTTVNAPAAGQSAPATFSIPNFAFPPGSYSGSIALSNTPQQSSTADDVLAVPFDVIDFAVQPSTPTPFSPVQNIRIGGSAEMNLFLTETGPVQNVPVPLSGLPVSGVSYGFASNPANPGVLVPTIIANTSTTPGAATVGVTGNLHGVTRTVSQPAWFFTGSLVNQSYPGNSPSFPVGIQPSGPSIQINFRVSANWNGQTGPAQLAVGTVSGFSASFGVAQVNPGDFLTLTLTAFSGAPQVVTAIPITLTIPNTFPTDTVTYNLYVLAQNLPDLAVTNIVPSGTRSLATNPWLAGETLGFNVTVNNFGAAPSTGHEQLDLSVNGIIVNSTLLSTTPVPAGGSTIVPINLTAPYFGPNESNFTGSAFLAASLSPDANDSNINNNFFSTSVNMADWNLTIASGFPGLSNTNPVLLGATGGPSGSTRLVISTTAGTPVATFAASPGLTSTNISFQATPLSATSLNTGNSFTTTANVQETPGNFNGPFYAQVTATLPAGVGIFAGQQMQRQQTIFIAHITINPLDTVRLTTNRNNFNSTNGGPTTGVPLQLNGLLPEQVVFTPTRVGSPTFPCTTGGCPGHADLTFSDSTSVPDSVDSNPHQLRGVNYNTSAAATFVALAGVSGFLSTTSISDFRVSAEAVSQAVAQGTPPPFGSNPIGNLLFNIGDLGITSQLRSPCVAAPPGGSGQLPLSFQAINGFNLGVVGNWSWSGLPAGVTVSPSSGSGSSLPTFTFQNTNTSSTATSVTEVNFVVSTSNSFGTATVTLPAALDLSPGLGLCNVGGANPGSGRVIRGRWGNVASLGGVSFPVTPARAGALPELSLSPADVSFSPSVPRAGDTVEVRFRIANTGNADATHVPVVLRANGQTVASDTFDIAAGRTTLGALQWNNARPPGINSRLRPARGLDHASLIAGEVALTVELAIDPGRTVKQRGTNPRNNTAPLPHFTLRGDAAAPVNDSDSPATGIAAQRAYLAVAESACTGFRFVSGGATGCDAADVEITVDDGRYTLASQSGIADLGPAGMAPQLAAARYAPQAAGIAGHSYAVQLAGGRVGILTLQSIRSYGQLDARTRRLFRGGSAGKSMSKLGSTTGPVEAGDVSGHAPEAAVYFEIAYTTP